MQTLRGNKGRCIFLAIKMILSALPADTVGRQTQTRYASKDVLYHDHIHCSICLNIKSSLKSIKHIKVVDTRVENALACRYYDSASLYKRPVLALSYGPSPIFCRKMSETGLRDRLVS